MSRSLVKAYNALRVENARLRAELYGNEYDDMLAEHMAENHDLTDDGHYWHCETCQCPLVPD